MKILITGVAGFVGCKTAEYCKKTFLNADVIGIDNLGRRGSESNIGQLGKIGVRFVHGDIRNREDIDELPKVDWIIDCAAIPTVTAGIHGGTGQLVGHNLIGTLHLLEKCRKDEAGFIMLSTSRVYSINALNGLQLIEGENAYSINGVLSQPRGASVLGIGEEFSTQAPVSLYGATKLASETMAIEYGETFHFPVWINRCGVIAGAGQFGKIDQGIFSFWAYQYILDLPLAYIGFGGTGKQVRDFVHPYDIFRMVELQIKNPDKKARRVINLGGGVENAWSLRQLNDKCAHALNRKKVIDQRSESRAFDIPLYITDFSCAEAEWGWRPSQNGDQIMDEIFDFAKTNIELIKSFR